MRGKVAGRARVPDVLENPAGLVVQFQQQHDAFEQHLDLAQIRAH